MVFSIWDEQNVCLAWDETVEYCHLFGLKPVPVLFEGEFDLRMMRGFHKTLDLNLQEGYVVRRANSFPSTQFNLNVLKWVRKNHVQTTTHWSNERIVQNILTS